MNYLTAGLLLGCFLTVVGIPFHEGHSVNVDTKFISEGTNELATALLQGYVQKEDNMVYSPFGYSAILAVFSEGARGESRDEIASALHFPNDVEKVRLAYKSVLERFVGKKFSNSPEFKNWFYIYKNYTVEEEIQNVLRKYYLTEIKCVDRPEDFLKETKKSPIQESTDPDKKISVEMSKIEKEQPILMEVITDDVKSEKQNKKLNVKTDEKITEDNSAKTSESTKQIGRSSIAEESMKITEEVKKIEEKSDVKEEKGKFESSEIEMQKTLSEMETPKTESNEENRVKSMENFSGISDSSLTIKSRDSTPRMVIFNGLYYKGEWETPFVKKPADDSRVFYKSPSQKIFVSTIHSEGVFNYGNIPSLDSRAIELPYKGGRYSLLILVPSTVNGLNKLISDLSGYSLSKVYDQMTEKLVNVCLPTFEINTISKPISSSKKLGLEKVESIFNPDKADLSGISTKDAGLFVEELVQMVTFKVDADYSKANFLTASIASSRSNVQNFQINQPFLFYLRDNLENVIIVNGKVVDPTPKPIFYFT